MDAVVARCPDCGMEQAEEFARCFVCLKPSRWWCQSCREWTATRLCPACNGGIAVPSELALGTCAVGATVGFKITVRNRGKKLVSCTVSSKDAGVAITNPRLVVPANGTVDVRGGITLPLGPLGPRTFRLHFDAPIPAETVLAVDAMAAAPHLNFLPALVVLRTPNPANLVRTSVALKNTGNVPLTAALTTSATWLKADPKRLTLASGESVGVKLRAKCKKTDYGTLEARLTAEATGGPYEVTIRYVLPDPELAADPVSFGDLVPGRAAVADVVLRNTGRVRVEGTVAARDSWLRVAPARVNLPPAREKKLRVRAILTAEQDGPQNSELIVSTAECVVLRVPITAIGIVPKPVLRAVRKQRVRNAIGPPVERGFQVANDGDGRLDLAATADKPWVKIITPELQVGPGRKRRLRYALDLPSLPRGEHTATIKLTSNGGNAEVPLTVQVLDPNPVLEVLPAPHLGTITPDVPLSAFVQVRNSGIGLLHVKAESDAPGVIVSPEEADVRCGPPVKFNLAIPTEGLASGEHEVLVRFATNGGDGSATVSFRLPVEEIEAPEVIDLGDRAAGRVTGGAVLVQNTGPDRVTLRLSAEHQWLRPGTAEVSVNAHETVSVPFRLDLPPGALGPLATSILLEGRTVRLAVAVRVVARKVELIALPAVILLGDMTRGLEQRFNLDVLNAGEMPVEIPDAHVPGELEVWVRGTTVQPGERVTLAGRARMNAKQPYQKLRVGVPLADETSFECVARVVPSIVPKVVAVTAATGGLIAGGALTAWVGWWAGAPLALVALVVGAWLFWLDMA